MKKTILYLCSIVLISPLMGSSVPSIVQVPSSFNSETIATNTSRYFLKRVRFNYPGNESYVLSLYNAGSQVARISALGCESHAGMASNYFTVSCYKNSSVSYTSYNPINNSTLQESTTGSFLSASDEVYTLQAVGVNGTIRGFEYIPKELYSVIIAPGETLTVTLSAGSSAVYNLLIMWEEIIN